MKTLAVDTAAAPASLALLDGDEVLGEIVLPPDRTLSQTLLPEIQALLASAGLPLRGLELIAAGLGPGGFTALRISLAVAKGLAFSLGLPLIGAATPDAMVWNLTPGNLPACPVIDARKRQVYAAFYRPMEGGWARTGSIAAYGLEELAAMIDQPTVFLGPGLSVHGPSLQKALGDLYRPAGPTADRPFARQTARLAQALHHAGDAGDPAAIAPLYIRPPDIRPPKENLG